MNATVRGRRWTAIEDLDDGPRQPGDFQFATLGYAPTDDPKLAIDEDRADGGRGIARIAYACPKTGEPCGMIRIGYPDKPATSPSWRWDGNVEAPTLDPSINCNGGAGCGWHGYLVAGEFRGC